MEEINTILAYESSLKIIQEKNTFSFSIDSTVLSFFVNIKAKTKKIIDLGCGNATIPLFLSLFTKAHITGVEIQESAYNRAIKSVSLNNLDNQIEILNKDIKDINKIVGSNKFDIVISNPPYFKINDESLRNKNDELTIARHEVKVNIDDIVKEAFYLLKDMASLYLVFRTDRFLELVDILNKYHFSIKRLRFVYPKPNKDSYIFMIEAVKNGSSLGLKILEPLYIYEENGDYSKEILDYFHYGEENEKK